MTNPPGPPRLHDTAWMARAQCRGQNTDQWFPERGGNLAALFARRLCTGCPVKGACRDYAIDNFITHGIWGGMSPDERKEHRARRNRERKGAA